MQDRDEQEKYLNRRPSGFVSSPVQRTPVQPSQGSYSPDDYDATEALLNAPAQDRGVGGFVKDLGVSVAQGAVKVPGTVLAAAETPFTGGAIGKAIEDKGLNFGDKANERLDKLHTEKHHELQQGFADAGSDADSFAGEVVDKLGYAVRNPSTIVSTVAQSLPDMVAGAKIGSKLSGKGERFSPQLGAGIGEGAMMMGHQAEEIRKEQGGELLTPEQRGYAALTGVAGALFAWGGNALAKRLGIADIDVLLTKGMSPQEVAANIASMPAKSVPKAIIQGAIQEGFLEELPQEVSETILQNLALDRDWNEGLADAVVMGPLAGMAMGGPVAGVGAYSSNRNRNQAAAQAGDTETDMGQPPTPPQPEGPAPYDRLAPQQVQDEYRIDRPSERLGLNPDTGPLSAAAATAVDSGLGAIPDMSGTLTGEFLGGQEPAGPAGFIPRGERTIEVDAHGNPLTVGGQPAQGHRQLDPERTLGYTERHADRAPLYEVGPDGVARPSSGEAARSRKERIDLSTLKGRQQTQAQKQPAAMPEQRSPEQQAQSIWDSMNAFERNKAAVDTLGHRGVLAKNTATKAWDKLSAEQQAKLVSGLDAQQGQRWTDPNQKVTDQTGPVLQNRDRTSQDSINQMRSISNNPDYSRLKTSGFLSDGAPVVVDENIQIPALQMGVTDTASAGNERFNVQYAVVEADQLMTSNSIDGTTNTEYQTGAAGKARAIAGNGRIAGLQSAWAKGNASQYKADMAADRMHGIDSAVIEGMRNPILVRLLPQDQVTDNIGDLSNRDEKGRLSPVEQAKTDMGRIDLDNLKFTADGAIGGEAIHHFRMAQPAAERVTEAEARKRLTSAIFQKAYGNDQLTEIQSGESDDAKSIMSALAQAAPSMSRLEGAGEFDIRPLITQAGIAAVNAARRGTKLADYVQQSEMGIDPMVYPILEMMLNEHGNIRSSKYIGEQLTNMAKLAYDEANSPSSDMFGEKPKRTAEQVIQDALTGVQGYGQINDGRGQESLGQRGRSEPDAQMVEGPEGGRERPADTRQTAPTQPEAEQEQPAAVENNAPETWRSNYIKAAKIAREKGIDPKQHKKLADLVAAIDDLSDKPELAQPKQTQQQLAAVEPNQPAPERTEAHKTTMDEWVKSEIENSKYAEEYRTDPVARKEKTEQLAKQWRKAVTEAAKDGRIQTEVLDDFVSREGETGLLRTFRGEYEAGIKGYDLPSVRSWDKTYAQYMAQMTADDKMMGKGSHKSDHARIVRNAIARGEPVPENVRKEHEQYTPKEPEDSSILSAHGLPEGASFETGIRGLVIGKIRAVLGDDNSNWHTSKDAAAKELARELANIKAFDERAKAREEAISSVRDSILAGKQPADGHLKEVFGLQLHHTYVPQADAGWFLVEHLGVSRNKIKASLGHAGGTITSDSGTKYPIVYPRKLHEVFGVKGANAAEDAQAVQRSAPEASSLELTQQTEESLAKDAERLEQLQKEEAAQKAKQKAAERKQRERDADKARADEVVDNFQLGQPAEEVMSGMGDIFDASQSEKKSAGKTKASAEKPTINERRAAATLAKPSVWKELRSGDGTVKSSIERAVREGWTFSEVSVTDTAAKKRDEEKVKQVSKRYMLGLSNPNIPEVKAGLEAKARLDAGEHKKPEYRLSGGQLDEGSYYTITKTAYDYAKTLESNKPEAASPEPTALKAPTEAIEDFGEKIGGARKDLWEGFSENLGKVADEDIASHPLSRIWPEPNYKAMIDAGESPRVVATIRALREEINNKPRAKHRLRNWAESVKSLRSMAREITDGTLPVGEFLSDASKSGRTLEGFAGRVELYELVGHEKSLAKIYFAKRHYSLYRGDKDVTLWVVENNNTSGTFGGWPSQIATGKTKEQAIEAFKKAYNDMPEKGAKKAKQSFDIWSERGREGYLVGKKIGRHYAEFAGPFKTTKEAREYVINSEAELTDKLARYREIPAERRDTERPRAGEDHRQGRDVTPEQFSEAFGFRGVEFGNWVQQGRRQADLNQAYDALMDMAAVLDIPAKAVSLNGSLGLAFGARGKGGKNAAKAHYEPGKVVINLSKRTGAGSLGHEWWHALDNYFAKARKSRTDYMTTERDVNLASRGSNYQYADQRVRKEIIDAFGELVKTINLTALRARSRKLDNKRTKEYWTTGEEMSARAFESYLISKLQDKNGHNDYLANIVDESTWKAAEALGFEMDGSYPYPTAGEVPAIRAGFDHFFKTIETRETDSGVQLYSLSTDNQNITKPTTEASLIDAINENFPALSNAVNEMLKRGSDRKKGGLIIIPSNDGVEIAKAYSKATGRPFHNTSKLFSDAGSINGFYDTDSGLTFIVGPNVDAANAPAVLLHELVHSQQREGIDRRSLNLINQRSQIKDADLKSFLDRVANRMADSDETGNALEATSYIVEQAVMEGRSKGFTMADSKFLSFVENTFGSRVAGVVRDFIKMVRQFALRNNLPLKLTVDDLVQYAIASAEKAAGTVQGDAGTRVFREAADYSFAGQRAGNAIERNTGDASPTEAIRVQQAIEGGSLVDAAKFLTQSSDKARAAVARKVLDKLEVMEKSGVNLELNVVHVGDSAPEAMASARAYTEMAMDSKGRDVVVWVNGADVAGKVGVEEEALLHELVHAATSGALLHGSKVEGSPHAEAAKAVYDAAGTISEHISNRFQQAAQGQVTLTPFEQDMRDGYNNAFRNMDEVVAWAMTNREAQQYLDGIPSGKNRTLWTRFVEAVRSYLGLPVTLNSVLSEVLAASEQLMGVSDTTLPSIRAFWHKRNARMITQQAAGKHATAQSARQGRESADEARFSSAMADATSKSGGKLGDTIKVDGVDRPTKNSSGQLIHPTEEGVRNFWRWFGDSKVVDDDGRPLVMYHGTPNNDFNVFEKNSSSKWMFRAENREMFFFSTSKKVAEFYADGGRVISAYLKLENPVSSDDAVEIAENSDYETEVTDRTGDVFNPITGDYESLPSWEFNDQIAFFAKENKKDGFYVFDSANDEDGDYGFAIAVFNSSQIKSATDNSGAFDPTNPDIRFSRTARQAVDELMTGAAKKIDSVGNKKREMPKGLTPEQAAAANKFDTFRQRTTLQDKLDGLRSVTGKKIHQKVFDQFASLRDYSQKAFMQAHLSKGSETTVETIVRSGAPYLKDGAIAVDTSKGGFLDSLKKNLGSPDEANRFFMWVAGNRADDLSKEHAVYQNGKEVKTLATKAEAEKFAATLDGNTKVKHAGRENLFTQDDIAALKELNSGKTDDGKIRALAYGEMLKELNRYQKALLDMAEQAGTVNAESRAQWESEFYVPFYRVMEKEDGSVDTRFGMSDTGLMRQEVIKRLKGGTENLGDPLNNLISNWEHIISSTMKNMAANEALTQAEELGAARKIPKSDADGTMWTLQNGQRTYWEVADKDLIESITALDFQGYNNGFMKAAGVFKRALTMGVTISPSFRIRSATRDILHALAVADVGYNPLKNAVEGWKQTGKDSELMAQMLAGGGAIRFGSFTDGKSGDVTRRMLELDIKENQILDTPEKFKRFFGSGIRNYMEIGDRLENNSRVAAYQRAMDKTGDHLIASFEARDIMNFTSMGSSAAVRALAQTLPFFNARLQGMSKLYRGAKNDPRRFWGVVGTIGAASALLYLLNADDDEYKSLPGYVRDTYWPIKVGGKWVYVPKPFEVGSMASVIERFTELAVAGDDYKARDFKDTIFSILVNQLQMNPVPQIILPAAEAWYNYDTFRGREIDSMAMQRLMPGDRYNANTSAGAVALGRAMNISPQKLEHLVSGYFGWLGLQALNVSDLLGRTAMDLPSSTKRDMTQTNNWFIVGDFVKESGTTPSKYTNRFYDVQREINQIYATANAARSSGDIERYNELMSDPKMGARRMFASATNRINLINKQIRSVTADRDLSAAEKNERLKVLYERRDKIARDVDDASRR